MAIADAIKTGNRYGHTAAEDLIAKIAVKEGVPKEYVMLGPGSSDLLEKVGITHFIEGGNILAADPTYMSIIKTASSFGADWNAVPLKSDWEYDLEGMKNALNKDTKLVYICNPNNPTGTITNGKKLWDFCKEVSEVKPVFVDEAYLEFMDAKDQLSMVGLLHEGKDIIISRTFSKVYGMAGIRVGYIVALPSTLEKISEMVRSNMGLNITALHGALTAIEDKDFVINSAKWNAEVKDYLYNELENMGIKYVPSHTSFVLFPIQMEGKGFLEKMFSMQVGVRSFEIFDKTYCRVSIGTLDEMKIFTSALKEVLA
jgi:histidinol-phosphate aminotransferase